MSRDAVLEFYERYLAVCNRHAFHELAEFLAPVVMVNGDPRTPAEYAGELFAVHHAFPDYRWELRRAVVEEPWLAVQLRDQGTHLGPWRGAAPTGRLVNTDEFAMYRLGGGRIVEVWATADNARLLL